MSSAQSASIGFSFVSRDRMRSSYVINAALSPPGYVFKLPFFFGDRPVADRSTRSRSISDVRYSYKARFVNTAQRLIMDYRNCKKRSESIAVDVVERLLAVPDVGELKGV